METVFFFNRNIPVLYDVECAVVGGGTAGAVAALSALEEKIETVVIEKTISLGGTQTNALVSPMMPTQVKGQRINDLIIERLHKENVQTNDGTTSCSWFNTESLSYVLETLIVERGGHLLYDANYVDCLKENGKISCIIVNTSNGLYAVKAKTFVDATADALLSRTAGVPVESGNEEGQNQQISFRFEMGGIDVLTLRNFMKAEGDTFCKIDHPEFFEIAMVPGKGHVLEPYFQKGLSDGHLKEEDLKYFQAFTQPGKNTVMSFNCPHIPGVFQTTDPVLRSKAVTKGREMIRRLTAFLPKAIPGFEQAYLIKEASQLGIRESYRIKGKYILTEQDYLSRARFEDGIARGDWYIDVHSVKGQTVKPEPLTKGEYYEIPYRSLITHEAANLIVAGRHISSTFLMQASLRIQPTVRDVAQVAGMACAYSVKYSVDLNNIDGALLRRQLRNREEKAWME
ncbi:FAD-dependent oxidoreductase [Jeotgalibacillus sp. ET6]|uniref:FAD-dependent oxidoreductase n=1 Tax=Jeotgalibacillus sp. ET6 TaxID=3037260 RepID=UPI002418A73E|nr:FAD-dependent oxidoreductase [Jeotgalibacillus sp. ET6]MDG5471500.1 FAD-dependent oxidoreductase [Jeotgalibacillus sp. ET6]